MLRGLRDAGSVGEVVAADLCTVKQLIESGGRTALRGLGRSGLGSEGPAHMSMEQFMVLASVFLVMSLVGTVLSLNLLSGEGLLQLSR